MARTNPLRRRRRDAAAAAPTPPADAVEPQVSAGAATPSAVAVDEPADGPGTPAEEPAPRRRTGPVAGLVALVRCAHPRLALATTAGVTLGALAAGREPRELGVVAGAVLAGQVVLGFHNDLVDRERDRELREQRELRGDTSARKPVAEGRLEPGTVWFFLAVGVLLLVPLAVSSGITAATALLLSVLVGILGNVVLRTGWLSWLPWAVSYALLPAFLSYGGWGGQFTGEPPGTAITALAAALGVGVHVLVSLWGLEADDAVAWRTLPLRLGRRLGSTRLLVLTVLWLLASVAGIVVVGSNTGLGR